MAGTSPAMTTYDAGIILHAIPALRCAESALGIAEGNARGAGMKASRGDAPHTNSSTFLITLGNACASKSFAATQR